MPSIAGIVQKVHLITMGSTVMHYHWNTFGQYEQTITGAWNIEIKWIYLVAKLLCNLWIVDVHLKASGATICCYTGRRSGSNCLHAGGPTPVFSLYLTPICPP